MKNVIGTDGSGIESIRLRKQRGNTSVEKPILSHYGHIADIIAGIDPKEAIECIQEWSNKHLLHKQKTFADDFFEKYPNAKRHENGRPLVYRCDVYGCECNYKKAPEVIYWRGKQGIDDCLTCWNEPYPEEVDNESK